MLRIVELNLHRLQDVSSRSRSRMLATNVSSANGRSNENGENPTKTNDTDLCSGGSSATIN